MSDRVTDKSGAPIEEGDTVVTKIRGGKREGEVRPAPKVEQQSRVCTDTIDCLGRQDSHRRSRGRERRSEKSTKGPFGPARLSRYGHVADSF